MAEKKNTIDVDEDDLIAEMRENDRDFHSAMSDANSKAIDDLKMLLGEEQWDPAIAKIRQDMKRPIITQNILPQFNKQVKNEQRQQRPQVKCIGVDDKADPKTANIIAGLLRNIWYQSQADAVRDMAFDTVVDCGRGAWRIVMDYEDPMGFDQGLRIRAIDNPLSVSWDLSCKQFDTADKSWCNIEDVIPKKVFEKRYPKAQASSTDTQGEGTTESTWFLEDGIRVIERWYVEKKKKTLLLMSDGTTKLKEGDDNWVRSLLGRMGLGVRVVRERETEIPAIRSCICSGAEILEGPFEIPGQYIPIMIAFGEVMNIQGKKHYKSLHRDAKQTQQIHNYLMTALIESFALQPNVPYVGTKGMFEGLEDFWKSANIGGQAYLPFNPDPQAPGARPERQMPPQVSNALPMMIDLNMRNMRAVYGMYESDLGMKSNEKSGVAIRAKQQAGDTGTFVFVSNFDYARQFEGRCCVDLIPHYYDAPRAQMITGLEGEHEKVLLNQPFMANGKQMLYDIKTGKYDVIITTGPSFASQREETLQAMIDLIQPTMQTNPNAGSVLLLEIVKNINTVNSDRLQQLIKATLAPELQQIIDAEKAGGDNPEMAALAQSFEMKLKDQTAQMEEIVGQLQQELQAAQAAEQSKIAKIEADREMGAEKMALEREKIQAEFDLKREIAMREADLAAQKVEAEIRLAEKKFTAELVQKDRMAEVEGEREERRIAAETGRASSGENSP